MVQAGHIVPCSAITPTLLSVPPWLCVARIQLSGGPIKLLSPDALDETSLGQVLVASPTNDSETHFDPTKLWECL